MKIKRFAYLSAIFYLLSAVPSFAQDLAPQFKKVKDGIFIYAAEYWG
jgi:hypothetical protein